MINVMVVEDDPMARKLFEIILASSGRYNLTASIESASLAEFYCMTSDIDLILMDVCTALHASGLDAASKIKKKYPEIRIIIVTSQPECDFIDRARSSGVDSFWYKDPSEDILLEVMDRTMAGESIYPDTTPILDLGLAKSIEFTARELEVLRELTSGDTDETQSVNSYSEETYKEHVPENRIHDKDSACCHGKRQRTGDKRILIYTGDHQASGIMDVLLRRE